MLALRGSRPGRTPPPPRGRSVRTCRRTDAARAPCAPRTARAARSTPWRPPGLPARDVAPAILGNTPKGGRTVRGKGL
eukprot:3348960-Prymnesium_polylepis.1